jgi:hypothetical protein
MSRMISLVLAFAMVPAVLQAQEDSTAIQHRSNCNRAEQIIASGHPAPEEEWALGVVWNCAGAGPTLAAALSVAKASSDTAYLNALTAPFIQLRDGTVFTAALALADDNSASVPARVAAIRTLIYAVRPGGYVDPAVLPQDGPRTCFGSPSPHSSRIEGSPLPANHVALVRALATRLRTDSAAPREIRQAATCTVYAVGSL